MPGVSFDMHARRPRWISRPRGCLKLLIELGVATMKYLMLVSTLLVIGCTSAPGEIPDSVDLPEEESRRSPAGITWQLISAALGEAPAVPVIVRGDTAAYWTAVTLDVAGNPETLANYEGTVLPTATVIGDVIDASLDKFSIPLSPEPSDILAPRFAALPPGRYRYYVRAVDLAGNISAWSGGLELDWDNVAPRAVTGLRVEVSVTVTIPPTP